MIQRKHGFNLFSETADGRSSMALMIHTWNQRLEGLPLSRVPT